LTNRKAKGKLLIAQSGGPTAVINQSLVGAILAARTCTGAILGARHGFPGVISEDFIELDSQDNARLEAIAATPGAALGSVRKRPDAEECARAIEIFRKHDVRHFLYIGGDGSAKTAQLVDQAARQQNYALCVVHIPKTIDNDLAVTDYSPGFPSAARFVALAFMGDDKDNRALPGIKINVVMGHHAGFLTAAAALARQAADDGPHLIYLPERAFDIEKFQRDIRNVIERHGRCIIAAAEGIAEQAGKQLGLGHHQRDHGKIRKADMLGEALGELAAEACAGKMRVRVDTFGYLQRSFPSVVSAIDMRDARRVGEYAARHAADGGTSGAVAIRRLGSAPYSSECFITPLASVADSAIRMPDRHIAASGSDITQSWLDYVAPLVGDLPRMGRL
jgi:6-phosphofructokinase 1